MQDSSVTSEAGQPTIVVRRDASIRFRGGNTITNTDVVKGGTGWAIFISNDSSMVSDATRIPTPNAFTGSVGAFRSSVAQIIEGTVTVASGNALVAGVNSTIDLGDPDIGDPSNVQINGDVSAFDQSVIAPSPEVTINSNVTCSGNSLLTNDTFNGTAVVDCSNFVVADNNNVGIGTRAPNAPLHVVRDEGAMLLVENTSDTSAPRVMFALKNKGKVRFSMTNGRRTWDFSNAGRNFQISRVGTGVAEFRFFETGDMDIVGTLTQNSSRASKQDIEAVNAQEVLAKVMALPISEWSYKRDTSVRHLGPMAEDFHATFGLGSGAQGIATIDTSGVALAAIQGLKSEQDAQLEVLQAENQTLKAELAELKRLVRELVSQDKVALVK
jgi:hypothetical protein